ncbi:ion transporter [Burkholderia multivorans]|nr:ion transporter [Burkholderia multivorans]MCO1370234.1 ion transporter [Burkholderia multivorans]MCO1459533.1 ion transporter [Burkholderia multivorans]MCO1467502.1 ion transporter [Burkholderia multivorans]UQO21158.1 ion transporter [Burkholderia multivorans]
MSSQRTSQFDAVVLILIVLSVVVVMLDSVPELHAEHSALFLFFEWTFTVIFTAEYLLRLWVSPRPLKYAKSFFGLVDLIGVLPTYLAFLFPGLHALVDVRLLRLLRIFRVLRVSAYFDESQLLMQALVRARRKIMVFIGVTFVLTVILGTVIYIVEGPENGFSSIPAGVYWAAVTMSTTGYGDLVPHTLLGRFLTTCAILLGYGIIAFPTGILGAELVASSLRRANAAQPGKGGHTVHCPHCGCCIGE